MRFPKATWKTRDGRVRLYRGDALEWLPRLPRGSIDAFVTDPPYSSGGMVRGDRTVSTRQKYQSTDVQTEHASFTGDNRDQRGWIAWSAIWLLQCLEVATPGGVACVFSDWRQLPSATDALQAGGWVWRGIVPWDKVNARPMPNRFRSQCEYVVWATNGPRPFATKGAEYHPGILRCIAPKDRVHSTQKPVSILHDLCRISPAGKRIADPFLGSGSTGVAAIQTGRRFVGIEKDHGFFDIAVDRIKAAIRDFDPAPALAAA
jgi:site-specific DNA-methyltransferase (adenine-specific)